MCKCWPGLHLPHKSVMCWCTPHVVTETVGSQGMSVSTLLSPRHNSTQLQPTTLATAVHHKSGRQRDTPRPPGGCPAVVLTKQQARGRQDQQQPWNHGWLMTATHMQCCHMINRHPLVCVNPDCTQSRQSCRTPRPTTQPFLSDMQSTEP